MRYQSLSWFLACGLLWGAAVRAEENPPQLELKDGDVVAFIGNGFFEREGRYGYIETALTARYADRDIKFRNLGWSGDTVWCESRAYFGTPEDGFKHLLEHVDLVKPTVIILNYGGNEAFAGPEGLPNFIKGYERLLDELEKRAKRIVLLSPTPLRKPAFQVAFEQDLIDTQNENVLAYAGEIKKLALRRRYSFFSLLDPPSAIGYVDENAETDSWMTEDGIQLTEKGNEWAGDEIMEQYSGGLVKQIRAYARQAPERWMSSYHKLRSSIIAKNELFFHRHRPQNETYLRGFRKHEQGNNAAEILEFEKLVAEKEQEIAKLRRELLETLSQGKK